MSRITRITGPDGKVTTIVTRSSGCGCLTILAAIVVVAGPAAWFPGPLAVAAYTLLGIIGLIVVVGWIVQGRWLMKNVRRPAPTQQPPPGRPPLS